MRRGVVTPPYGCNAGGARQRADVGRPAGGREGGTPGSSCPTGGCGEPPRLPWVAAHSGASAAQTGGTGGNRGRDHPKSVQQRQTIPQSAFGRQLPLHKEALGDGGCGSPRRPVGPPRNDKGFLSFRGAERRGNPSFFTMDDGRGFGLPHERRGERHAESSCPTGGCGEPPRFPWVAAHSGASAATGAREGWKLRQRSSPKGPSTPDNPSVSLRLTAPFTQGSLWGQGMRIAASLRSSQ